MQAVGALALVQTHRSDRSRRSVRRENRCERMRARRHRRKRRPFPRRAAPPMRRRRPLGQRSCEPTHPGHQRGRGGYRNSNRGPGSIVPGAPWSMAARRPRRGLAGPWRCHAERVRARSVGRGEQVGAATARAEAPVDAGRQSTGSRRHRRSVRGRRVHGVTSDRGGLRPVRPGCRRFEAVRSPRARPSRGVLSPARVAGSCR